MPKCQHCGYTWSWWETFVRMFTFKNKLRCPSCREVQYLTKKSRNQLSLFGILPLLIWVPLVSFGISLGYILACEVLLFVLVTIWMPFLYKLTNKDDPMW